MLERDEPVNLLVMRPHKPPAATPRNPGTASHLQPPVDLNLYIDALLAPHAVDFEGQAIARNQPIYLMSAKAVRHCLSVGTMAFFMRRPKSLHD